MINSHFIRYNNWKKTTYLLISILLITLTIIYSFFYYSIITTQAHIKALASTQTQETHDSAPLIAVIQKIDKHELYNLYNALLEILLPCIKVETIYYSATGATITCRAQSHQALVTMLELCSKNSTLKKFALKKSSQERDEIVFVLECKLDK